MEQFIEPLGKMILLLISYEAHTHFIQRPKLGKNMQFAAVADK